MRVGIDCRYIRERPSGIGAYVEALVQRLPALAPEADFLLWANVRARRPLSRAPNVAEVTVRSAPNSPLSVLWPHAYAPVEDTDLFHHPHNILPRGVRCPAVVTVHDVLSLDNPGLDRRGIDKLAGLYYPHAVKRALKRAARLIVPTAATADRVLAWQPDARERLRVVPMAPDICFTRPQDAVAARREAATIVGSDAPYVLVVGQNSANKRHRTAIEAFARSAPPPWRLVLLQRLGRPKQLKRLAAAHAVSDRVVWLSHVSQAAVATLMQSASALLQPSLYEGFGLPAIEAMASGCPVIASDIPALREITGGAATLVPPGEAEAFADALRTLIASPARRQAMSEAGLSRARVFSWDRTARQTLEVYEETAGVRVGSGSLLDEPADSHSASQRVSMQ